MHVLRHGIDHRYHHIELCYPTPSPGDARAAELFDANRFTLTRQLYYGVTGTGPSLDPAAFVNGIPAFIFELKNNITRQTFDDAAEQYKRDRDPRELIFQFGRCIARFPFDKGWNDGAGNAPNPKGIKTDYLCDRSWPQRVSPILLRSTHRSSRRRTPAHAR